jgi:glycosyltransferase involved in cell wall biosynthesis
MAQELDAASRSTPLVSVSITAYNSERWLARALDSVLNQRIAFPIEIVIGDDCSQDGTVDVARSYQEKYPDIVKVFGRSRNVGIQRNYYETLDRCRGKFTAWLDADDYWTDPDKLAIQVDVLESDPSISVCCHYVRWISVGGKVERERYPSLAPGRYGLEEILRHAFIPTASAVFRTGAHRNLPEWYFEIAPTTDWPVWILSALSGDIVVLDKVMADYWLTPNSACWSKGDLYWYGMDARLYEHVESVLPEKWHRLVRVEKGKRYEAIAFVTRKQGDYTGSRQAAIKAFRSPFLLDSLGSKSKSLVAAVAREMAWKFKGKKAAV